MEDAIEGLRHLYEGLREKDLVSTGQAQVELWQPVLTPIDGVDRAAPATEDEALERVHQSLTDAGLKFSHRTVQAVHTALKVTEESPLLVLAGISGTGKSELPRRYAEAMGIHFLPVPVQPRWDSPQDLFGFFNYLEGRYRPTELTRALLQMDPVGPEPGRGWRPDADAYTPLDNEMLLVLFDEMNLARVEYYFSELLSRLEMRRGLDRADQQHRGQVEIPLEVGRGGQASASGSSIDEAKTQAILRLLVGTNVLFVGTMNEDESTQTLSDKVIDRSNLLRFGRPAKLRIDAPVEETRSPVAGALDFATWHRWLRQPSNLVEDLAEQMEEWIQRTNAALQSVGRPFAFRVHRAIKAYVVNYPQQDDQGVRRAMADQIEFRILPRLRGLDPQEQVVQQTLETLVRMVGDDLADERLAEAIQASRAAHPHQFAWMGLDRSSEG